MSLGLRKACEMRDFLCNAKQRCRQYTCTSPQDILSLTAWKVSGSHIVSLLPCTNKIGRVSSTKGLSRRLSCRTTVRELARRQRSLHQQQQMKLTLCWNLIPWCVQWIGEEDACMRSIRISRSHGTSYAGSLHFALTSFPCYFTTSGL